MERTYWYKDAVFYQIWPRSFKDSDGDGVGDLMGVYEKLDYIKSLHVDAIWFSPLYPSPNADYGYDVMDYMDISGEYGGMEAFKKVLDGAHQRGMRVIMDLVVNHTSDEHPWFQASRRREEPYTDYYIWRKPKRDGTLPNNWDSMFEGKAWQYDEERKEYYLHLFAIKQADLNMDNPRVRDEVKKIMRFWLDMGVDGFREDVITFISKDKDLPNGFFLMPAAKGITHYSNGPHLHEYLMEFRDVLDQYDCVTIGEAPLVTARRALQFIGGKRPELDMMIPFQCMEGDCILIDYVHHPFSLLKLKHIWRHWQDALRGRGWNFLYLENHDHPRIISRYGSEKYRVESGKSLAASYLFQQGTPIIYQGQEIGMTNIRLKSIDMYEDVQTINNYHSFRANQPEQKRMERIWQATRESARTPMQWDDSENAGFTEGKPWFYVNPNYPEINVAAQEDDPESLLNFYRRAAELRSTLPVVRYGTFKMYYPLSRKLFVYERRSKAQRLLVICSYSPDPVKFRAPRGYDLKKGQLILRSHGDKVENNGFVTRPYETRVYLFQDRRGPVEV
ncbi:MAG: alpha-glucosidase [Oscillospiraceae bacterium]|nr:alpha-glucosidase [Oscillospiraceae bacterium]